MNVLLTADKHTLNVWSHRFDVHVCDLVSIVHWPTNLSDNKNAMTLGVVKPHF